MGKRTFSISLKEEERGQFSAGLSRGPGIPHGDSRRTCRPAGPSSVPSVCADGRAGAAGLGVPEPPTFKLRTN